MLQKAGKDVVDFFLDMSAELCDWDGLSAFLKREKRTQLIVSVKFL